MFGFYESGAPVNAGYTSMMLFSLLAPKLPQLQRISQSFKGRLGWGRRRGGRSRTGARWAHLIWSISKLSTSLVDKKRRPIQLIFQHVNELQGRLYFLPFLSQTVCWLRSTRIIIKGVRLRTD